MNEGKVFLLYPSLVEILESFGFGPPREDSMVQDLL